MQRDGEEIAASAAWDETWQQTHLEHLQDQLSQLRADHGADHGAHHDAATHPHERAHGQTHIHQHIPLEAVRAKLSAIADATLHAIRRHWLAGVNTLLGTLIGVALLTPIGYALGLTGPSDAVFHAYRFICGQTPSHTFYIAGYQMCLCTRCLAIYSALLTGGILLALLRHARSIRSLGWKYWVLAMIPMALDGGTQLFGLRESNLVLRLLTGAIFGLATAWFLFPQIEEASRDRPWIHQGDYPDGSLPAYQYGSPDE